MKQPRIDGTLTVVPVRWARSLPAVPLVELGSWVQATELHNDGEVFYAVPGDVGHVIDCRPGYWPTVLWERTGLVTDVDPDEFTVLCGPRGP